MNLEMKIDTLALVVCDTPEGPRLMAIGTEKTGISAIRRLTAIGSGHQRSERRPPLRQRSCRRGVVLWTFYRGQDGDIQSIVGISKASATGFTTGTCWTRTNS